jgi:hypothetical protein
MQQTYSCAEQNAFQRLNFVYMLGTNFEAYSTHMLTVEM